MMSEQINIFGKIARILNRGNSIVVDGRGVEENVESIVKAAWYLGTKGNYQKRITAPWLVDPLLVPARKLRMKLYLLYIFGQHHLVCELGRDGYGGIGYSRLDEAGLAHDQQKAMRHINEAAEQAFFKYLENISIMVMGKNYPAAVDGPRDILAPIPA